MIAIPTPIKTVPAHKPNEPTHERKMIPTFTATKAPNRECANPKRAAIRGTIGENTAKHSSGNEIRNDADAAESPTSSLMRGSSGLALVIGIRRFVAISKIPAIAKAGLTALAATPGFSTPGVSTAGVEPSGRFFPALSRIELLTLVTLSPFPGRASWQPSQLVITIRGCRITMRQQAPQGVPRHPLAGYARPEGKRLAVSLHQSASAEAGTTMRIRQPILPRHRGTQRHGLRGIGVVAFSAGVSQQTAPP